MLDLHGTQVTPGAVLVLSANPTVPLLGNDGQTVAGVPVDPKNAILMGWGGISPTADTIANIKLTSQDLDDPINGITVTPGAANLTNIWHMASKLKYERGSRTITMGTNTGVVAGLVYYLDAYQGGPVDPGTYFPDRPVITPVTTFGGALTALTWGSQAYTPATSLPEGKYAILGAWVAAIANAALIRFQHSDFNGFLPGFPVANYETISTASWDKIMKTDILMASAGWQFKLLSDLTGSPMCPVFSAGPSGTGLVIQAAAAQADTPTVILNLNKVG
jgi:hypothetical protein